MGSRYSQSVTTIDGLRMALTDRDFVAVFDATHPRSQADADERIHVVAGLFGLGYRATLERGADEFETAIRGAAVDEDHLENWLDQHGVAFVQNRRDVPAECDPGIDTDAPDAMTEV